MIAKKTESTFWNCLNFTKSVCFIKTFVRFHSLDGMEILYFFLKLAFNFKMKNFFKWYVRWCLKSFTKQCRCSHSCSAITNWRLWKRGSSFQSKLSNLADFSHSQPKAMNSLEKLQMLLFRILKYDSKLGDNLQPLRDDTKGFRLHIIASSLEEHLSAVIKTYFSKTAAVNKEFHLSWEIFFH